MFKKLLIMTLIATGIGTSYADDCVDGFAKNNDGECVKLCNGATCPRLCDAGYLPDDAGNCQACTSLAPTMTDYDRGYCPGDNIWRPCPEISGREVYLWTNQYPNMSVYNTQFYVPSLNPTDTSYCVANYALTDGRGTFMYKTRYDPTTDKYSKHYDQWWSYPYAGYYVTEPRAACASAGTYFSVAECVAGGYCPGKSSSFACNSGPMPYDYGLYTCPDNTYSDAGASECTPCPYGLGNSGDNVASHAGVGSCKPIECPAGQYLGDDGHTCTLCDVGYYCPGDNKKRLCVTLTYSPKYSDETGLAECKQCPPLNPSAYTDTEPVYSYWNADPATPEAFVHKDVDHCRAVWYLRQTHGRLLINCSHGPNGYHMDGTSCQLSTASQVCDAGYYINDTNGSLVSSSSSVNMFIYSYPYTLTHEYCTPAGVGYYQDGTGWQRTKCPDGTSTHSNTAASSDACVPLCANGGKKLHAGEHEFNIWPNGTCTSPSIGIGLAGGTCCVNLESGRGTGINVEWDGKTYHTVN